jgi:hypothetical protein
MQPVSESRRVLHHVTHVSHLKELHCYHCKVPSPWMHQYLDIQDFRLYDLDRFRSQQPPADFMSVQQLEPYNQKCNVYVAWITQRVLETAMF